ncbi:MAG: Holliday junction resolvase RuvX [Alphaproteobacteria bacterium]|nr:Holliday junction resolvase RuvX [Alphaproteobacteria bacterium]
MAIDYLKNIAQQSPKGKALMGLDVGKKTIGVAVCDPGHSIATPLLTVVRVKFGRDVEALKAVIREYEVGGFVIGLPLNMDGSEGPRCQSVRDFAAEFALRLGDDFGNDPWIALWDERLSTASVEDFVDEVVDIKKRRAKEKGILDKLAAQHILQGALDYMDGLKE